MERLVRVVPAVVRGAVLIDFFATQPHYVDHLRPTWDALPPPRGDWYTQDHRHLLGPSDRLMVVSSYGDLRDARRAGYERLVLAQHGCGMSYSDDHPAYPGGRSRENVVLLLDPNEFAAARDRAAHPTIPVAVVGCPKLDAWFTTPPAHRHRDRPLVVFSFHWPGGYDPPETRWAFSHYRDRLLTLKQHADRMGYRVAGHGHPKAQNTHLRAFWHDAGFGFVRDFAHVVEVADQYVCDNSSTLYEFAAVTNRPVLVLNSPSYRRDINHGIRFWQAMPGIQVDTAADLGDAIIEGLSDPAYAQQMRREAVELVYPVGRDGTAAKRAAEAIMGVV